MPNLNYAEVWNPELLEIRIQETLSSPFITQNVRWLDAKTFHFTQMSTSGYKSHNRNGGWNTGKYVQCLSHSHTTVTLSFLWIRLTLTKRTHQRLSRISQRYSRKHSLLQKRTLCSSQRQLRERQSLRAITHQQPLHHTQRVTCSTSSKAFFQQAS